MPFTTNAKDTMLDALPGTVYASAHTADPGETGTSEVTGGTYARESFTLSASASANRDSASQPVLNIPAGTTVTHVGFWDAVSAGTFLGYKAIASESYSNDGTLTVNDADFTLSNVV